MATDVYLHIGPRKTGTTFVQRAMSAHADTLAGHGILYPTRFRGRPDYNHVAAVFDRLNDSEFAESTKWSELDESAFPALMDQIARHPGRVILSAEVLGSLRTPGIGQFLSGIDAPIHAVVTLRSIGRVLPSSWQQHLRNLHPFEFDDFLGKIRDRRMKGDEHIKTARTRNFWRAYKYPNLVRRWAPHVEDLTAVTVPADGDALWSRILRAFDLEHVLPERAPTLPRHRDADGSGVG